MADNQQPSSQLERKCKSCGEVKPLDQFAPVYCQKRRGKQYRQHTCLTCHRAKNAVKERRRRAADPQRARDILKRWRDRTLPERKLVKRARYERIKDTVFAHYGGYRCSCCGETEPTMLTIDHKLEDGAAFRRRLRGLRWSYNFYEWIINNGFPEDLQVLCYNCNLSKHRNGGVCAHKLREGSETIPKGSRAKRPEVHGPNCTIG
jgi:hypothetical protein